MGGVKPCKVLCLLIFFRDVRDWSSDMEVVVKWIGEDELCLDVFGGCSLSSGEE